MSKFYQDIRKGLEDILAFKQGKINLCIIEINSKGIRVTKIPNVYRYFYKYKSERKF